MPRRLLWSVSLLALLLLLQFGLWHRYAHAQPWGDKGAAAVVATADSVAAASAVTFAIALASGLESSGGLLTHDAGLCVLLDHLAAGDGHSPPAPLQLAVAILMFSFLAVFSGNFIARRVAPFQARGPPAAY